MKDLMSYVPKKKTEGIALIEKTGDGYEVVLAEGWLYAGNNGTLICPTIAELRHDLKSVEYVGTAEYNVVMGITVVAEVIAVAEDDSEDIEEPLVVTVFTTLEDSLVTAKDKMDLLLAQNHYLDTLTALYAIDSGKPVATKAVEDYEDMMEGFIFAGATFVAGSHEIALSNSPRIDGGFHITHFDNNGPHSHTEVADGLSAFVYLVDISAMPMPLTFASYLS